MNKKYLSVILFGALMLGTTGTFTSCKDYDDDINNLQEQITANADAIKKLQDLVGDGKFVTGVTSDGNTITFTFSDNSTVPVTVENEQAQKVEVKNNELYIDDQPTGIKVAEEAEIEAGLVKAENGTWWVLGEDGKYTDTGIVVSGVTVVGSEKEGWELTITDAEGNEQKVKVPGAASAITEVEILGYITDGNLKTANNKIEYNFRRLGATLSEDLQKWNAETAAVKKVAAKQVLSTLNASNSYLLARVAPATLDASQFSFAMINSQMKEAPIVLGTPKAYEGLLTRAAVSGNGLWLIPTTAKEGETYNSDEAYIANFETSAGKLIAFALKEENGFATNYDLTFTHKEFSLDAKVAKVNDATVVGSKDTERDNATLQSLPSTSVNKVNVGKVNIAFNNPIYDAHLHIDDATIQRWNITDIDGTSFTVGKRPDDITSANFQVNIHYVTLKGEVKNEWIPLTVAKSFAGETVIAGPDHMIQAKVADDKFSVSLDDMFTDLGNNSALWKADVVKATIKLYQVGTATDGSDKEIAIPTGTSFTVRAKDNRDVTTANTATATKFVANLAQKWPGTGADYALDEEYYVLISFTDAAGDVLNTVKIPFTLNIPALSTFLVKQQGVFNGTNEGTAYIFGTSYENTAQTDKLALQYDLTYAFVGGLKDLGTTTIKFKTNGYIGGDTDNNKGVLVGLLDNAKTTYVDADMTTEGAANQVALVAKTGKNNDAYGQAFKIEVSEAKYLNIYAYGDAERKAEAFTIKMLSPIKEGSISAADGSTTISIDATDNQKIVESKFLAKTYSTAGTQYKLFPSTATKKGSSIYEWIKYNNAETITITPKDDRVLKVVEIKNTVDGDGGYEGYVKVEPVNPAYDTTGDITVTVNDVWGFNISQDITIEVKR